MKHPPDRAPSPRSQVMDDFVRNFLVKMGMTSTLEKFEAEWYELEATGRLNMEGMPQVPDVYNTNQELNGTVMSLKRELQNAKQVAHKAQSTWDKFRKERDFHRLHHKRIGQEKNKLLDDIKKLRKHYSQYEPTIKELKRKYELAMKEKMLVRIDRDRMADKLEQFEVEQEKKDKEAKKAERARQKAAEKAEKARLKKEEETAAIQAAAKAGSAPGKGAAQQAAVSPGVQLAPKGRVFEEEKPEPCPVENFNLNKTFKGHQMSVSNLALHPRKAIIATASDDATWKMWDIPSGDLIMSGDGHRDWVAGVDFHPAGTHLASASGDLHREGLGFRPEAVHDNLRRAHAGCVERGFPRVRGLHRVVLAGSQRAAVGPDVRQVQAGVPRARGQRQRGVLAAGDEQFRHRLLGQDGFPLGHAHGAVRADAVRTLEQREPPELQHRRRRHRVVRRRRHGEALGRSHGCGDSCRWIAARIPRIRLRLTGRPRRWPWRATTGR